MTLLQCSHQFVVVTKRKQNKLECRKCAKFYGYIRDDRSLREIQREIEWNGHYDVNKPRGTYK